MWFKTAKYRGAKTPYIARSYPVDGMFRVPSWRGKIKLRLFGRVATRGEEAEVLVKASLDCGHLFDGAVRIPKRRQGASC